MNRIKNKVLNKMEVRKVLVGFFLILIAILVIKFSFAFPPIATEFYGTAILNVSNATVGSNVTAYDADGVLCGSFVVQNTGYYGLLSCKGDDNSTPVDEGAVLGDTIQFYINGTRATFFGNATWEEGKFRIANLTTFNLAPEFDHNLTHQYVNESYTLIYDINCSDTNPQDQVVYYDNVSIFDIDLDTGLINWTPNDLQVGNYSIQITCSDGAINITEDFNLTVWDIEHPPILSYIDPQIAVEGELFTLHVYAYDLDLRGNNLSFSDNVSFLSVSTLNGSPIYSTGLINFTPTLADVGNHSINIIVSDGNLSDAQAVSFRIVRGPYCGDGSCSSGDNCYTCEGDCGACPEIPAEVGGDEPAPVLAPLAVGAYYYVCREKWECAEWSVCSPEGIQTRKCLDVNKCGTKKDKLAEVQNCVYQPTCNDGMQNCHTLTNGTVICEEGIDCGGACAPCYIPSTCFDGIKNQGEEEVDCGGPCPSCEKEEIIKIPIDEIFLSPCGKQFPWILLMVLSVLIVVSVGGDFGYVHHIKKKDFEKFRKKIKKYKNFRRKLYKALINTTLIIALVYFYIYFFSCDVDAMLGYLWIIIALLIAIPIGVSFIFKHYQYYEYQKQRAERMLIRLHQLKLRQFVNMENNLLSSMTKKVKNKIYALVKSNAFTKYMDFYKLIIPVYSDLSKLHKLYQEKFELAKTTFAIKNKMALLLKNELLIKISKGYPEFRFVLDTLTKLVFGNEEDTYIAEEEFLDSVREVSLPHMKSIIQSDPSLVSLYNQLVDVYKYYKEQHTSLDSKEKEVMDIEKLFAKKIGDFAQKSAIIEKVRDSHDITSVYNTLVELFDRFNKKQEIFTQMMGSKGKKKENDKKEEKK